MQIKNILSKITIIRRTKTKELGECSTLELLPLQMQNDTISENSFLSTFLQSYHVTLSPNLLL